MYKLGIAIKKELLLLLSDKVGLIIMFAMPLLMVFIITIIQDSAYKIVNENKISILIVNNDDGPAGSKLIELMGESSLFEMTQDDSIPKEKIKDEVLERDKLTALYIPNDFSDKLGQKAGQLGGKLFSDMGLKDEPEDTATKVLPGLVFVHDPIMQENFCYSVVNIIGSFTGIIENQLMVAQLYEEMGIDEVPEDMMKEMLTNKVNIEWQAATNSDKSPNPNSTQHNVPAWTIFAMFFMVVSLGSNVVKERVNGSFIRLKTMPSNFSLVLFSKMFVYLLVAIGQVAFIFSVGMLTFPSIGLPSLVLPDNFLAFAVIVVLTSLSAVSYAFMVGAWSKTQEQAGGFGAVSIIIFGALGGIWVPTFVMPGYMQTISNFSPMHWCLEGFYTLFLKGGSWTQLYSIILVLFAFIIVCQLAAFIKLRIEKII